jgi:TPR repeat protein
MVCMTNDARALVDEARRLRRDGQAEVAEQRLRAAAQAGIIDAMIELARMSRDSWKKADSDQRIDAAEAALHPGDLNGHISLNGAYSLGLGRGERDVLEKRALYHLEQVAQAGNPVAQERLALEFLEGTNGCEQSVEKFEHWIGLAMATGSLRAVYIYVEYLFRSGRPIPLNLLAELQAVRLENKATEKLLGAIDRREKKTGQA